LPQIALFNLYILIIFIIMINNVKGNSKTKLTLMFKKQ